MSSPFHRSSDHPGHAFDELNRCACELVSMGDNGPITLSKTDVYALVDAMNAAYRVWHSGRLLPGDPVFRYAYEQAANDGKAQLPDFAEYGRVLSDWLCVDGRKPPAYPFIEWRASVVPGDEDYDIFSAAAQARLEAMRRGN